jgi:hypothetical protein
VFAPGVVVRRKTILIGFEIDAIMLAAKLKHQEKIIPCKRESNIN